MKRILHAAIHVPRVTVILIPRLMIPWHILLAKVSRLEARQVVVFVRPKAPPSDPAAIETARRIVGPHSSPRELWQSHVFLTVVQQLRRSTIMLDTSVCGACMEKRRKVDGEQMFFRTMKGERERESIAKPNVRVNRWVIISLWLAKTHYRVKCKAGECHAPAKSDQGRGPDPKCSSVAAGAPFLRRAALRRVLHDRCLDHEQHVR